MTRKFWGMVMVTSLLITLGAAYFWFEKMAQTEMALTVTEPVIPAAHPIEPPKPVAPPPESQGEKSIPSASGHETRNILFNFPRATAESVFIVGDFNDWHRQPMVKIDKKWQVTIPLESGTYKYMFVVDEKRVRDPNNKNSADGKSLINVKPPPAKN